MTNEKKLRYSRQRELMYQYLLSTKAHPSAEMIYEDLKKEMQELSLGTVYRNLKLLEELGKVRRVANHQDHERYDACVTDHVHFLCTECGRVDDIDGAHADEIRNSINLSSGYTLTALSLTLSGLCPKCAKKRS